MSDTPVVLLHGLGRTRLAMLPLARHLRRQGLTAINVGYFGPAGLGASVEKVSRSLEQLLEPYREGAIDFVTHSMGGVVARAYLSQCDWPARGRLIQLAPPNQGSWLANKLRRVPLVEHVPALFDLGREGEEPRIELPILQGYEVGVIAGRSYGPWHWPHPSDGVVRVAETHLAEAVDWILLPRFHTVVMNGQDTWANVTAFLRDGRFLPDAQRLQLCAEGKVWVRDPTGEVTVLRAGNGQRRKR